MSAADAAVPGAAPEGSDALLAEQARRVRDDWAGSGLAGAFWARHLGTGEELGFAPDRAMAVASVMKLPLALVVLDRCADGRLDPAEPVLLDPSSATRGPTGLGLFRHPATVAVEDLVVQALAVSDNAATDALLGLVAPADVSRTLAGWGLPALVVRHRMRDLYEEADRHAGNDPRRGLLLAVQGTTRGGGHVISMLDPAAANAGTARALVDLLDRVWRDDVATPWATGRLRTLLGHQLTRHRLAAEVASDAVRFSGKTGTFLNLRHEVGVVETRDGERIAMAALTESSVVASVQPEADAAIARAARRAFAHLRD